jgi:hypothetical protein
MFQIIQHHTNPTMIKINTLNPISKLSTVDYFVAKSINKRGVKTPLTQIRERRQNKETKQRRILFAFNNVTTSKT